MSHKSNLIQSTLFKALHVAFLFFSRFRKGAFYLLLFINIIPYTPIFIDDPLYSLFLLRENDTSLMRFRINFVSTGFNGNKSFVMMNVVVLKFNIVFILCRFYLFFLKFFFKLIKKIILLDLVNFSDKTESFFIFLAIPITCTVRMICSVFNLIDCKLFQKH